MNLLHQFSDNFLVKWQIQEIIKCVNKLCQNNDHAVHNKRNVYGLYASACIDYFTGGIIKLLQKQSLYCPRQAMEYCNYNEQSYLQHGIFIYHDDGIFPALCAVYGNMDFYD